MFDINKYMREHRKDSASLYVLEVVCKDGFRMSVQAGPAWYSRPREWVSDYERVEVGYPSQKENRLMPFIGVGETDPTEAVYFYVPIQVVNEIVESHGGLDIYHPYY